MADKDKTGAREPLDFDKVDRALEMAAIDWLQWDESLDDNKAQMALTLMSKRKMQAKELAARVQKLEAALFRAQGGLIDIKHMGPSPQSKWAEQRLTEIDQILKGASES